MIFSQNFRFLKQNKDDDPRNISEGDYFKLVNGRIAQTSDKNRGIIENIKGTSSIAFSFPAGTNKVVGQYEYRDDDTIYFFLYNSNDNHGIYTISADTITKVFESSVLGFTSSTFITEIDIIDDDLYWTDNVNDPRCINITKALAGEYNDPVLEQDITLIRRPPLLPLTPTRKNNVAVSTNNVGNDSFQFAYRYEYLNKKMSVISPYSIMITVPKEGEEADNNYIQIDIPAAETIPWGVTKIQLLYRIGNSGRFYVWKEVTDGSTSHDFYNDTLGLIVSNIEEALLFHDIPLKAHAEQIIRNRLFFGNVVKGFDLNDVTMTVSQSNIASTPIVQWPIYYYQERIIESGSTTFIGYYYKDPSTGLYYPAIYDAVEDYYESTGGDPVTADELLIDTGDPETEYIFTYQFDYNVKIAVNTDLASLKQGGKYEVVILFLDFAGRNSGVIRGDWFVTIEDDPTSSDKYRIAWDLSGSGTSEIPEWAHYYYIMLSPVLNKSFFVRGKTSDIWYHTLGTDLWGKNSLLEHIYVDVSELARNNIGYTWSEGDRIKLYALNGEDWDLEIVGQEGQYVFCENVYPGDLGAAPTQVFFEIYTPRLTDLEQRYYETGNCYQINNPGTPSRDYSITEGFIDGDVYFVDRTHYWYNSSGYDTSDPTATELTNTEAISVEAMNPNDNFYSDWVTNNGRVNVYDSNAKQKRYTTMIPYSNQYIPASNINELHVFTAANRYDELTETLSPILSFSAIDNLLISHHKRNTISIPIGVGYIRTIDGQEFIAKTDGVIDDFRVLDNGFGILPSSKAQVDDIIFWFDPYTGNVVRYTQAGTISVSAGTYNHEQFFREKGYAFIDYLDTHQILGGYDPEHKEYLLTFPVLAGVLDTPETHVFSLTLNAWQGEVEYRDNANVVPDIYMRDSDKLYSFLDGSVWKHHVSSTYNNFYGSQYNRYLKFYAIVDPSKTMVWNNLWLECEDIASSSVLQIAKVSNVHGQETYLVKGNFEYDEGVWKAQLRFDKNSSGFASETLAMRSGDRMRSKVLTVEIEQDLTTLNPLNVATLLFKTSEYTL